MSRRLSVLLLALAACALALYGSMRRLGAGPKTVPPAAVQPVTDVEELGWLRIDPGPRPPDSMVGLKGADLPAHYRSLYRLKPDRRVLYAFEEIDRMLSDRTKPATLSVRFENGRWSLSLEHESIGTLPEIPAFAEEKELLRAWARNRSEKYATKWDASPLPAVGATAVDPNAGGTSATLDALRALNENARRRRHHVGLLEESARRSIWLVGLDRDTLQLSDPLVGHTLALLVLAQTAAPGRLAADEALLDFWMGFSAEAEKTSRSLDSSDPVRAYVGLEPARPGAAERAPESTALAEFLGLRRLAGEVRGEPWFAAFRRSSWAKTIDPASLTLLLLCGDYTTKLPASEALARSLLEEVSSRAAGRPAPSATPPSAEAWPYEVVGEFPSNSPAEAKDAPQAQTRQFEAEVGRWAAAVDGPLFDAESLRAFYRSSFYSAIADSANSLIDQWANMSGIDRFARSMADPAPGTATQLREWMLERAGLSQTARVPENVLSRLEGWKALGPETVVRVARNVLQRTASGTDPLRRSLLRLAFRRLDARPSGLEEAARAARFDLLDLPLGDRCAQALVREKPVNGGDLVVRYAYWERDEARLREIAVDARSSAANRLLSLKLIGELGKADFDSLQAAYRQLMDQYPTNDDIVDAYVDVCLQAGKTAAAHRAIAEWLARRPTKNQDLIWAHLVARDAEVFGSEKRWREAWRTLEPALPSGKGDVLFDAAWILEEEGAWDEALAMARQIDARYPSDGRTIARIARLLWRQREYAQAADFLAASKGPLAYDFRGPLASSFAKAFEKADPHETQAAFTALRERKINPVTLVALARAIGAQGDHQLAFALLGQVPSSGTSADTGNAIWAHDELAQVEGKEAAAEWLWKRSRAPHELAIIAFQFQRYGILLEPLKDTVRPKKVDEVELVRAAALLMVPGEDAERKAELVQYFEGRKGSDWAPYALYILGAEPQPEFLSEPAAEGALANIGWFAGLKATREGRYEEASDWFEVAVQTDQVSVPPQAWSYEMLRRWQGRDKLLSLFAPDDALVVSGH